MHSETSHDRSTPRRRPETECVAASQSGGVRSSGQYSAQLANSDEFSFGNSGATPATETAAAVQWCDRQERLPQTYGAASGDSPEHKGPNPRVVARGPAVAITGGIQPARPASSDDRAARFARALAAGMIEAGLLALAAALLIAASPTTPIELVTNPPLTGR